MAGEFYRPGLNDLEWNQAKRAKEQHGATPDDISVAFKVKREVVINRLWDGEEPTGDSLEESALDAPIKPKKGYKEGPPPKI